MIFQTSLTLVVCYFISATLCLVVALSVCWIKDSLKIRLFLAVGLFLASWWCFFNAFQVMSTKLSDAILFSNLQYLSIAFIPVLFFRFTIGLAQGSHPSGRFRVWLFRCLWVIPAVTTILVWFDLWLGLVRSNFKLSTINGLYVLLKNFGPWFAVHTLSSYLLMFTAVAIWFSTMARQTTGFRKKGVLGLLSMLITFAVNLIHLFPNNILGCIDFTPFCSTLVGLMLYFSMSRFGFLSLLPIARTKLMDSLNLPVLVFDDARCLVFVNVAASYQWSMPQDLVPCAYERFVQAYPWFPLVGTSKNAVKQQQGNTTTWWNIETLPASNTAPYTGIITIGHDVTDFHEYRLRLEKFNRELENKVAERTALLTDANSKLQDELDNRTQMERQVFYFTLHDPLTGAASRNLLLNRIQQSLEHCRHANGKNIGLMIMDYIGFHAINEKYGHNFGDAFLRNAAQRITGIIRTGDLVARYNKDIFLVLIDSVADAGELLEVTYRLKTAIEQVFTYEGKTAFPHVRIGLVLGNVEYQRGEDLIRDAELTLETIDYTDHERIAKFQPEFRSSKQQQQALLDDLSHAIVNQQLHLIYQPIVDLNLGTTRGFEVLLRWNHPVRGIVSPSIFIPLAEQNNLIIPLGLWAFRESALTFAELRNSMGADPDFFFSINVSPEQLRSRDFIRIIAGFIQECGVPHRNFSIELTETALIENIEHIIPILEEIRSTGMGIKLDDFGTGYASLQYLQRLPIHALKIDQSFVSRLAEPQEHQEAKRAKGIIKALVQLALETDMEVIAEGIETENQKAILTEIGCQFGQGYLFSRGLQREDLNVYLGLKAPILKS